MGTFSLFKDAKILYMCKCVCMRCLLFPRIVLISFKFLFLSVLESLMLKILLSVPDLGCPFTFSIVKSKL